MVISIAINGLFIVRSEICCAAVLVCHIAWDDFPASASSFCMLPCRHAHVSARATTDPASRRLFCSNFGLDSLWSFSMRAGVSCGWRCGSYATVCRAVLPEVFSLYITLRATQAERRANMALKCRLVCYAAPKATLPAGVGSCMRSDGLLETPLKVPLL